jgi:ketosteroid isomerase-like protein
MDQTGRVGLRAALVPLLLLLACDFGLDGSRNLEAVAPYPGVGQVELWRFELVREDRRWAFSIRYQNFESWASFFAPGGSQITAGVGEIRGPEEILSWLREASASQAITGLTWDPSRAEVSNAGDLGYTVGEYRISGVDADGVHRGVEGTYVSIWRRQEDGSWKAEMTLGNPSGPRQPQPLPGASGG